MIGYRDESRLRHTLWVTRLHRWIAHLVATQELETARRLRAESSRAAARARILQRRSRWLVRTGKPLPQVVGT